MPIKTPSIFLLLSEQNLGIANTIKLVVLIIEVGGFKRVYAISDEDLERETDVKTSTVHFCRFEFNEAAKKAIKYGAAVKLGCDHPNYKMSVLIPLNLLESLREDLS